MRSRFFILPLIFILAFGSFAVLLAYFARSDSIALAALSTPEKSGVSSAKSVNQPVGGRVWLASVGLEAFFYGVLGVCGIFLALRAIISALYIIKDERSRKMPAPVQPKIVQAPEVVIVRGRQWRENAQTEETYFEGPVASAEIHSDFALGSRRSAPNSVWASWSSYRYGLTCRLIFSFTGVVAMFGLFTIFLVHFTLFASLRRQVIERARLTAINVGDNAAGYLFKNNAKGLRELLRKHVNQPEVAYIIVQNRAGKIFAHTLDILPAEVQNTTALGDIRAESQRSFRLGDGVVYEVTVPVMDGKIGAVRLGLWRDEITSEINRDVMPLVKVLLLVVGGGVLMAVYLAWRINRPILRLVRAAHRISSGDLDAPALGTDDKSEFGELSRALERMRSSIKAALVRLGGES
jgi:HAMP domain-containing protein